MIVITPKKFEMNRQLGHRCSAARAKSFAVAPSARSRSSGILLSKRTIFLPVVSDQRSVIRHITSRAASIGRSLFAEPLPEGAARRADQRWRNPPRAKASAGYCRPPPTLPQEMRECPLRCQDRGGTERQGDRRRLTRIETHLRRRNAAWDCEVRLRSRSRA
jgi:hypothetical protein